MKIKRKTWEWHTILACVESAFQNLSEGIGRQVVLQKWEAVALAHLSDECRRKIGAAVYAKGYQDESVFSLEFRNSEACSLLTLDSSIRFASDPESASQYHTWRVLIEEITLKMVNA